MKGLILSGGKGTRLRPLTFSRAKQFIPIANKPNLHYVVEDLVAAGLNDIGVVISPETGPEIRQSLGDGKNWSARFTFIEQDSPLGLAHAVLTARPFLGRDPFIMYLGDNLLSGGIVPLVEEFGRGQSDCIVLLTPVADPGRFGVAVVDQAGNIVRLVEKPKNPPSNLALVGVYAFGPAIHDVIATLKPSARGEYEITDAISGLIAGGSKVAAHQVRGWWKDTGRPSDLLEANQLVLSQIRRAVEGQVEKSELIGAVVVEAGARIVNSRVRGPVHIAAGALIEDSRIGPFTSIGPRARVIRSEVANSILLEAAVVEDLDRALDASLIGQDARVSGRDSSAGQAAFNLVIGDACQVKL